MNRRSFMQSVAAAFAAPVLSRIHLPVQYREIDWELFCDYESGYYDLTSPFSQLGCRAATDSKILLAMPDDTYDDGPTRKLPNLSCLPWDEFETGGWSPLPAQTRSSWVDTVDMNCPECFGRGGFGNTRRCPAYADDTEWDDPCQTCCRSGWLYDRACDACKGTGSTYQWMARVNGVCFDESYINRIRSIGDTDVKIFEDYYQVSWQERTRSELLLFRRGDGTRGFLMPCHDHEKKI